MPYRSTSFHNYRKFYINNFKLTLLTITERSCEIKLTSAAKQIHFLHQILRTSFIFVEPFQHWLSNVSLFPAAASQRRPVPSLRDVLEQQSLHQYRVEQHQSALTDIFPKKYTLLLSHCNNLN